MDRGNRAMAMAAMSDPKTSMARLCCTGQQTVEVRPFRSAVTGGGRTLDVRVRASGSVRSRQSRPRSLADDRCAIAARSRSPV